MAPAAAVLGGGGLGSSQAVARRGHRRARRTRVEERIEQLQLRGARAAGVELPARSHERRVDRARGSSSGLTEPWRVRRRLRTASMDCAKRPRVESTIQLRVRDQAPHRDGAEPRGARSRRPSTTTRRSSARGLGLDSLDALQLAMSIEEQLGVRIPEGDEARPIFASVRALADHVGRRSRERVRRARCALGDRRWGWSRRSARRRGDVGAPRARRPRHRAA